MEALIQMDGNILLWIQDHLRNPVLTPVVKAITSLGNSGAVIQKDEKGGYCQRGCFNNFIYNGKSDCKKCSEPDETL